MPLAARAKRGTEAAMGFLSRFRGWFAVTLPADRAFQLAVRCEGRAAARLSPVVLNMSLPQQRGYARARARRLVAAELERARHGAGSCGSAASRSFAAMVLEAVVDRALALVRARDQSACSLRRAA
jgi:hypothetical protein